MTVSQKYQEVRMVYDVSKVSLAEQPIEYMGARVASGLECIRLDKAIRCRGEAHSGQVQPLPGEEALVLVRRALKS